MANLSASFDQLWEDMDLSFSMFPKRLLSQKSCARAVNLDPANLLEEEDEEDTVILQRLTKRLKLGTLHLREESLEEKPPRTQRNRPHWTGASKRRDHSSEIDRLSDSRFKRMFRVDRGTFNIILDKIEPHLQKRCGLKDNDDFSESYCIPAKIKLAATLRWLAGGSYLDITYMFELDDKSFFHFEGGVLWPTIVAIDNAFRIMFDMADTEKLEAMSQGFSRIAHSRMQGCVMAIDGLVVKTRMPYASETEGQLPYRNRKNCYAFIVLAGCDHQCKFTYVNAECTGGCNDAFVWNTCQLKHRLDVLKELPAEFYMISDEGLPCTEYLLTPYGGRVSRAKDSFNFHLSLMRQCIERAFGMLVRRFGIFWRRFEFGMNKWGLVVSVCMKLHNLLVDAGEIIIPGPYEGDLKLGDDLKALFARNTPMGPTKKDIFRRQALVRQLRQGGYDRPLINKYLRRARDNINEENMY
jgi:hypothetical protein